MYVEYIPRTIKKIVNVEYIQNTNSAANSKIYLRNDFFTYKINTVRVKYIFICI